MSSPGAAELSELAAPRQASGSQRPTRSQLRGLQPTPAAGVEPAAPGEPRLASPSGPGTSLGRRVGPQQRRVLLALPAALAVSPWRRISNRGSRLTWRRTRSAPCLR